MKNNLSRWQLGGFVFTSVFGVLLHFAYDWSGENSFIALFSGVNESTWEHTKLLFFPMFIFSLIESRFIAKDHKNFWCTKLLGTLLGILLIPAIFYTYNGAFGKSPDFVNIGIYFAAAAAVYVFEARRMQKECSFCLPRGLCLVLLCLIALLYMILTGTPVKIPLFLDPTNGRYGIPK